MEDKILKFCISNKLLIFKNCLAIIFFGILIYDMFYSAGDYRDKTIYLGLFLWIVLIYLFKLKAKVTYIVSLALIFLDFFVSILNREGSLVGRIIDWIYLLLIIGVFQSLFELHKKKNK